MQRIEQDRKPANRFFQPGVGEIDPILAAQEDLLKGGQETAQKIPLLENRWEILQQAALALAAQGLFGFCSPFQWSWLAPHLSDQGNIRFADLRVHQFVRLNFHCGQFIQAVAL